MIRLIEAAGICFGLVGAGLALGWALHTARQRRTATPVPNRGHVRRLP